MTSSASASASASATTQELRATVATGCRVLAANGHSDYIWGHLSARDPAGRGLFMKGSGLGLEEIEPDDVVLLDEAGDVIEGDRRRHSEWPLHAEVLKHRPDVGAVVHTHPPHAVALAAAGVELEPVSNMGTWFAPPGVPRFEDTAELIRDRELGAAVARALGERDVLFLVNHGIVAVGADVRAAVIRAVLLEAACRQQLLTRAFGGAPMGVPDEALAKGDVYAARTDVLWDYLVRRLKQRA
ncbi:MAG TPA: class II aldolase/adducin family protein [Conexibacter sp.]|jgi:L-fuculose-phosphate aldolase